MAEPLSHGAHLTHPKYRTDIDGLRAIAILAVIGFHAFPEIFTGGFIGVDVFFVISGFLISTIIFTSLDRNSFSFAEFYVRRIRRIFPALLLVLSACFAAGWFALLPGEYKQLGKHIAGGSGFISNFILWNESGYFDNAAETKPLLHLWSLGIEEQFYIAWPLLAWIAWETRLRFLYLTIAIALLSFLLNVRETGINTVNAFYLPDTRFWELMLGSILAIISSRQDTATGPANTSFALPALSRFRQVLDSPQSRSLQSILGVILIATGLFAITKKSNFPGWWALLPAAGAVLVISAGSGAWLNRTVLSNPLLVWIGLISYPLYLWHWPLLSYSRIMEGGMPSAPQRMVLIASSFLLAWLTYRFVERPVRSGGGDTIKISVLVSLMAITGYVGYNCYQRDGLGFRYPEIVQEFATFNYDYSGIYREGTCFLREDQTYTAFNECEPHGLDPGKPSILIWGDSFSAHLYPGFSANFGNESNIIQRTASGCPPIMDLDIGDRPYCREINNQIFQYIQKQRPEKIILAAEWPRYDWPKLWNTVVLLRKTGFTNIDLVGPVPLWLDGLPKQLYLKYRSDAFHRIPDRMWYGINPDFFEFEVYLSEFAKKMKLNYISPKKILCNEDGCITRLGDTGDSLTACDYGHLTKAGSIYLVSRFPGSSNR